MGYSYVFLGELSFARESDCAAWKASTPDHASFDTPDDWSTDDGGAAGDAFAPFEAEGGRVERGATQVKLRAIVDKGADAFLEGRGPLVAAFRASAAFGAKGELTVVGYVDYPGSYGVRVRAADGSSTFEELEEDEVSAVEASPAYAEAEALVQASLPPHDDLLAKVAALEAKKRSEAADLVDEPDMDRIFAKLDAILPTMATFLERSMLPESPAVAALVARTQADTDERMRARLAQLVEGAFVKGPWARQLDMKHQVLAAALSLALFERGQAQDEIVTMWIESPLWFLRDHERVRAMQRPDLDVRLAALLGKRQEVQPSFSDNHRWIVEALFASDPDGAPARATALLLPDLRKRPSALESLRWIVMAMYESPAMNTPAWHAFLRALVAEPRSTHDDTFDAIRDSALGPMAMWKLPEALALLTESFDALGVERACELLVALGDPAAIPLLEQALAKTKRKPERTKLERAIASLGGAPATAATSTASGHRIEVASSGRASCRGCKQKIAKGELRFGEEAPNIFSDGGEPTMRWYHLKCAAEKKPKLFGPALAAFTGEIPDRAALTQLLEAASAKKPRAKKKSE